MATRKKTDDPKKARELAVRKIVGAYHHTFNTAVGREVLSDLRRAFYDRSCFNTDALVMAHAEGQRDVVQRIIGLIDAYEHPEKLDIQVITGEED